MSWGAADEPSFLFLSEAIALPLDHQRVTVMQQAVEDRRGQDTSRKTVPHCDELIGRNQQACALVPPCDQLEKERGTATLEQEIPDADTVAQALMSLAAV